MKKTKKNERNKKKRKTWENGNHLFQTALFLPAFKHLLRTELVLLVLPSLVELRVITCVLGTWPRAEGVRASTVTGTNRLVGNVVGVDAMISHHAVVAVFFFVLFALLPSHWRR